MPSEAAKAVAHEVIATLGKSRRPVLSKIGRKKGYSPHTADTPKNITETKSYQSVMQPFVQKMVAERDRAIEAMAGKISKAKYRDLTDSIDKLTKNIQLLTGGSTQNIAIGVKKLTDDELQKLTEAQ